MRLDAIDLQNDGIWFLLRSIKENLGFFCDNTTVISFFENIFSTIGSKLIYSSYVERLEIEWFRKIIDIKTEIIEGLKSTKIDLLS